jgi:hypothetical protein
MRARFDVKTVTEKDGQRYVVSTVSMEWGGLAPAPYAFETMVFPAEVDAPLGQADTDDDIVADWGELDCQRYGTKEAAEHGHSMMVSLWSDRQVTA